MKNANWLYHGHSFPTVVISCAVRWYFRFQLSLRDVEELRFERGVIVKHAFVKASARVNNRTENGPQPTRERERRMRGFRDLKRT